MGPYPQSAISEEAVQQKRFLLSSLSTLLFSCVADCAGLHEHEAEIITANNLSSSFFLSPLVLLHLTGLRFLSMRKLRTGFPSEPSGPSA